MPRPEGHHFIETATEARAGATGHNVRYGLAVSTAAAAALLAGLYLYFFA